MMERNAPFSYVCNSCASCCHDKLITLSPFDVTRIARAKGISTAEALDRYTDRHGPFLKFDDNGACAALDGNQCTIYEGRPLPCRIYPLGIERARHGDHFAALDPAPGSKGRWGHTSTIGAWLEKQGAEPALAAAQQYSALLPLMRAGLALMVDLDKTDADEFRKRAMRQALIAPDKGSNRLIDALYNSDSIIAGRQPDQDGVSAHIESLESMIWQETNPEHLAAAAVMLAVGLGHPPAEAFPTQWETHDADVAQASQQQAVELSAASPSVHARRIFGGQPIAPAGRRVFRNPRLRALLGQKARPSADPEAPAPLSKVTGTDS